MTWVTAIASPSARPRPSVIAATIPPFTYGSATLRTISQRVAASATDASLTSRGTLSRSSRQIDDVIGTIMIVSTTIATRTPACEGEPEKNGSQPSQSSRNGSICARMNGPSTKIPQSPTTTLGTAASISTSDPIGARMTGGASSVRKSAIAIESGAASTTAPNDVTIVPTMNQRAPKTPVTGFQAVLQTKSSPKWSIAGHAPSTTFQTI